jgi:mono/diheme cytochrome c family protein
MATSMSGRVRKLLFGGVLALVALPWLVPSAMRVRADNPVWKGMRLAHRNGCFACHSAPHNLEVTNPASPFETIPSFAGGNLMMYVDRPEEVKEWIRDGVTAKRKADPEAFEKYQAQLIRMPAFGEVLAQREIDALAAYVLAADGYNTPPDEPARRGEEIARSHCLGCHNVGGAGGLRNPGSPFGYVPAWWGADFRDLVKDDAELREWITTGSSRRVAGLPLAAWFWRRQRVSMPAYDQLPAEDVDALVAYIAWLGRTAGGTRPTS